MTSAIEWVRALQAEGWIVAYVEVAEVVGAALVEAGLLTSEQVRPERTAGRIYLTTTDAVEWDAIIAQ
jgi:hypothetical protein